VSGDPARHPRPVRVPDSSATPSLDRTVVLGDGRTVAYAEWGDPDGRPVFLLSGDLGDSEADAADPDAAYRALPVYRDALATMFREAFRQGTSGFRDDWIATIRPWGFRLADVDRPVDVWWGDADQLTDRRHTLAAGIRSARLTIVEGAGHSVLAAEWPAILGSLLGQWPAARSRR
jgi:pimeloyl-ACP methyl ester carboxylesterase